MSDPYYGMHTSFRNPLMQFIGAAKDAGHNIEVGSGFRSEERQRELWEQALAKYGSPEKARKWVAPPGKSRHNSGQAADLRYPTDAARAWAHAQAAQYGLNFRMGHEPWHIEPLQIAQAKAIHSGGNPVTQPVINSAGTIGLHDPNDPTSRPIGQPIVQPMNTKSPTLREMLTDPKFLMRVAGNMDTTQPAITSMAGGISNAMAQREQEEFNRQSNALRQKQLAQSTAYQMLRDPRTAGMKNFDRLQELMRMEQAGEVPPGSVEQFKLMTNIMDDPVNAREMARAQEGGKVQGKTVTQDIYQWPAQRQELAYAREDIGTLNNRLDELSNEANFYTTGTPGKVIAMIPGTPAYNFFAKAKAVASEIALNTIASMRATSGSTGMGQMTDKDIELLQNHMGSLDTAQSATQIRKEIEAIKRIQQRAAMRIGGSLQRGDQKYKSNVGTLPRDAFHPGELSQMPASPVAPQPAGMGGQQQPGMGGVVQQVQQQPQPTPFVSEGNMLDEIRKEKARRMLMNTGGNR